MSKIRIPTGAGAFPKALDGRARRCDDEPASIGPWSQIPADLASLLAHAGCRHGILDDPEDVGQEAWVVVMTRLSEYRPRPGGDLRSWLSVVVRNRQSNLRRAQANRRESCFDCEAAGAMISREEDPAVALARQWIIEAVRAALEEARALVPEASYRVVQLKWIEGRTTPEISRALGLSATQVRDRDRRTLPVLGGLLKHRIRGELIERFGEDFDRPREADDGPSGIRDGPVGRRMSL